MTTKILIVRSSSLGDLVHMLPAISDIAAHVPDAQIDWVAESSFAEIPSWHPAVHRVITLAHRRWRKHWWSKQVRQERHAFKEALRQEQYDVVLDMQALMKSIWVVRQTKGIRHGLDWKSAREPLASLFYKHKHKVDFWQPAVIRQRKLAALTFGYEFSGPPDFGLQQFTEHTQIQPYAVVMPSASRDDKLWAADNWQAVFEYLRAQGITLRVLSGNDIERERAVQLVKNFPDSVLLPKMSLTEVAQQIAACKIMIGLDSGLTHLAAALGRPTIGIYCASTPVRTPLMGNGFCASLGDRGVPPSKALVLSQIEQALQNEALATATTTSFSAAAVDAV
ncbi:lipopolysaccharide heptosyltransferase I [Brackiella oedipodis]|uniref:lipopolysaccharide heptosyltransferase I n=1 Tax=Brackiella oedipodis TaxID=124225 RepID=UPI000A07648D|nr:lipopolysaccharide heptosyltransferase I [Brackiella oedipodis]